MNLSQPLEAFIGRHIDSIETLEILLLLQRSPDTYWMTSAIESHLGIKSGTAEKRLFALQEHGFVVKGMTGGFRYARNNAADANVKALAEAYAEQRTAVVNTVFSENLARLRAFSNAFKVKSE